MTSDRACHVGKSTVSLKFRHDCASTFRDRGRGARREVEEGSKPALEGVTRALMFWVMESSMALRESRRKSRTLRQPGAVVGRLRRSGTPLRAVVEKQNWGFSEAGEGGWLMISVGRRSGTLAASGCGAGLLDHRRPATLPDSRGFRVGSCLSSQALAGGVVARRIEVVSNVKCRGVLSSKLRIGRYRDVLGYVLRCRQVRPDNSRAILAPLQPQFLL